MLFLVSFFQLCIFLLTVLDNMKPVCQPEDDPEPDVVHHVLCTSSSIHTHFITRYNLIRLGNNHGYYMAVVISLHAMIQEETTTAQDHEEITVSLH